jgi:hypothetical protein
MAEGVQYYSDTVSEGANPLVPNITLLHQASKAERRKKTA